MTTYKSILFIAVIVMIAACNKTKTESASSFEVSVPRTTYKIGDTVVFTFSGNPNNITFFSGEPTHIYEYRNRTKAPSAVNNLVFTSNVTATGQPNNLTMFASSDFSGIVDSINVRKATWKDITSRAVLGTTTTNVSSGTINLSDFQTTADSIYIAYRYLSTPSTTASRARAWSVGGFVFTNIFPDGTVYTHNTVSTDARYGGFQGVSLSNDSLRWAVGGSLTFPIGTIGQTSGDEDWVISKSFKLLKVAPDVGVGIKNISQFVNSYIYKFTKAGTYTVILVANNFDAGGFDEVVRTITLTITP